MALRPKQLPRPAHSALPEEWYREVISQFVRDRDAVLEDAQRVTIELDAVIFDDGTLIGPDGDGKLATLFSGRVSAYQQWLQTIADRHSAGQSIDAAFAPVHEFQAEVKARMGKPRGLPTLSEIDRTNAAADVVRWRRRVGDADLPRMLEGLRLSPFVVQR